jgi:putative ABC transport system permease protein
MVLAPPATTGLVRLPLKQGRWLVDDDRGVVVLNHAAAAQRSGLQLGDEVALSLDGRAFSGRLVGVVEEIGAAGVAYVSVRDFEQVSGEAARQVLRIAGPLASVEQVLTAHDSPVDVVTPLGELNKAVEDHVLILMRALSALAAVMAVVGVLGLASAIGVSVVERTREIGVMKTLGATPARIRSEIVAEALVTALASIGLAFLASLPLAFSLDVVVGRLGFLVPLDLAIDPLALLLWSIGVVVTAGLAALVPAARAAALQPKDALGTLG